MVNPKLVDLIKSLDNKDILSLKQYIQLRIDDQSSLMKTFHYIINHRLNPELIKSASAINRGVFSEVKDKVVSNHLSTLYRIAEEWMVIEQLKVENFTSDYLVLKWQKKKGFTILADQTAKTIEKNLVEQKEHDLEKMQAFLHLLNYYLIQNDNKINEHPDQNIKLLLGGYNDTVKAQYLIFKTELENLSSVHQGDFSDDISLLNKVVNQLPDTRLSKILVQLNELVVNDSLDALHFLKKVLFQGLIQKNSQLHYIITSYCYQRVMRLWSKDKHRDLALVNEIFNYAISNHIFTKNGKIPPAAFHTFVTQVAFFTEDFNQTEQFILTWIDKVDVTKKEATLALARAQNCLYTGRYEEIFQYTWRSDFDTFNQKNLAQGIHLIATFMFKDKERAVFENTLNLSLLFLKRNKLKMSDHIYKSYKNLCHFMQKIHQDKNDTISLIDYNPLIYRSWCEKILKDRK